jgi:uncharacterized membrane protein
MLNLPFVPSWNGLHPLIVHFPIALLFVAPLFVILGIVVGPLKGRPFLVSALILMALGTGSIFVAVETGELASELVRSTSAVRAVLQQHQNLAETTEVLFTLLTVVLAALLFAPKLLRRELGLRVLVALLAAFLLFYITGALFLVKTAHQGARLVHEFGVKAPVASSVAATDLVSSAGRGD